MLEVAFKNRATTAVRTVLFQCSATTRKGQLNEAAKYARQGEDIIFDGMTWLNHPSAPDGPKAGVDKAGEQLKSVGRSAYRAGFAAKDAFPARVFRKRIG
jgi:hypothetical protein